MPGFLSEYFLGSSFSISWILSEFPPMWHVNRGRGALPGGLAWRPGSSLCSALVPPSCSGFRRSPVDQRHSHTNSTFKDLVFGLIHFTGRTKADHSGPLLDISEQIHPTVWEILSSQKTDTGSNGRHLELQSKHQYWPQILRKGVQLRQWKVHRMLTVDLSTFLDASPPPVCWKVPTRDINLKL